MLKSLEVKNFESHKHTIIEGLSDGFNLIMGASNVGKSGLLRALELASYNEFDPKSVRVGETKCEVVVETERGRVRVIRGPKANLWEVTPVGQPMTSFEKVGVKIVPEAERIIGLKIIKLGDTDIPVNIMKQLESHFMLASVGGQDASGSMRAQVIDEISGLSGIEGVIKDVSLDNHRFGREIRETELSMQEICKQLHSADELEKERKVLSEAEQALSHREEYLKASEAAKDILDGWTAYKSESDETEGRLSQIPDLDAAATLVMSVGVVMEKLGDAREMQGDAKTAGQRVKDAQAALKRIPDTDKAMELSKGAREQIDAANSMRKMIDEYNSVSEKMDLTAERVLKIGDTDRAVELVGQAKTLLDNAKSAKQLLNEISVLQSSISKASNLIKKCDADISAQEKEKNALLETIKVCPLTLGPVSPECIKQAREK